jgi:phosphatidylserine/phosphatidylglycerophosphate/cardiolipin synthase-like enzyme
MKKLIFSICIFSVLFFSLSFFRISSGPIISNLTYDSITQTSLTVYWTTDSPADSKIKWFAPDSNYQPQVFFDSIYNIAAVTNHIIPISNLQPAKIYKYQVISQNAGGLTVDSGYFITQSVSTGRVDVYFNHSVDSTVSTGEKAKGNQNFENILLNRIDSAQYSIDITLWEFSYYNSISAALINAKNRGVKIRFVCNHGAYTPQIDSLITHGIPVLKRYYDTTYDMHNKFMIFDYRYNNNSSKKFLWTGSTNVSHAQFNSDKNNIIVIQDESLCAVYTREFEEMWGSHTDMPVISRAKFGPAKVNNVPHILNVAGARMEVYFGPTDSISSHLINIILFNTTKSLFFCILKFNLQNIENAMHNVFNIGKQIKGVFDLTHLTESGGAYPRMKGLPVPNTWNPPANVFPDSSTGLVHHKYFIIDANSQTGNKITATGSFNWDSATTRGNDENSLIIFNARVNNLYYQEFYARYRGVGGETIGIQKIGTEIPAQYKLFQNYPNPFNPSTKIKFSIPENGKMKTENGIITLKIYDILGKKVATLINEKLNAGIYEIPFSINQFSDYQFPSGVYFYRLQVIDPTGQTGDFSDTKRMLLIK